jgi:ubiquinone biosynthesis accessory factor UbiJ
LPSRQRFLPESPEAAVCALLNRLLADSDAARGLLAAHQGRTFHIQAKPLDLTLSIKADGVLMAVPRDATPDVRVLIDTAQLWEAGWRPGQAFPMRSGFVHVTGDAAMAQTLSTLAQHWRPDVEDLLAQRIGDVAARQVIRTARSVFGGMATAAQRLAENLAEYASHETEFLTATVHVKTLASQMAQARTRTESLDKRAQVLASRLIELENRVTRP